MSLTPHQHQQGRQLDLFGPTVHAYASGAPIANADLYTQVARDAGIDPAMLDERVPVGKSGQKHSLMKRKCRWYQQSLRQAGIIEHVDGERGVWQLTRPAGRDLSQLQDGAAVVGFSTELGVAIIGSCENVFSPLDLPIALSVGSPPFPLAKGRAYGTIPIDQYADFLVRCLEPVVKALVPGGSIMLHLGQDVFQRGLCARSLYLEETVIALHKRLGLHLCDRFAWVVTNRAPGPVRWASVEHLMLHSGWDPIFHFTNDPTRLRCSNQRVLEEHTERHLKLIAAGGEQRHMVSADGAHRLRPGSFSAPTIGRIPRNVLMFGHTCASQREYKRRARLQGLPVHGAPTPLALAKFLIEYGSAPGDIVVDGFAGSQTFPLAAELLGRRWVSTEKIVQYVLGGGSRFELFPGFAFPLAA